MPAQTQLHFFKEVNEDAPSVTDMSEEVAVRWLFQKSSFCSLFVPEFIKHAQHPILFYGVGTPFCSSNTLPGDIDLMLVDRSAPQKAFVFECKRVKVVTRPNQPVRINNAKKVKHAVKQANAYYCLGFHATYLVIILLDDSRELDVSNPLMRYNTEQETNRVYEIPFVEGLREEIGVVYIKVIQPLRKHINHAGGYGVCVHRKAKNKVQPADLSDLVEKYIFNHGKPSNDGTL